MYACYGCVASRDCQLCQGQLEDSTGVVACRRLQAAQLQSCTTMGKSGLLM